MDKVRKHVGYRVSSVDSYIMLNTLPCLDHYCVVMPSALHSILHNEERTTN